MLQPYYEEISHGFQTFSEFCVHGLMAYRRRIPFLNLVLHSLNDATYHILISESQNHLPYQYDSTNELFTIRLLFVLAESEKQV